MQMYVEWANSELESSQSQVTTVAVVVSHTADTNFHYINTMFLILFNFNNHLRYKNSGRGECMACIMYLKTIKSLMKTVSKIIKVLSKRVSCASKT